ncbi:MAG: DUF4358 domain-containing protein [Oscillospiraceae bacterium]|nr:DUF4358 domain-containing protein [Oscillospiraceae bacterium]
MKKFSVLIAFALTLCLAACGFGGASDEPVSLDVAAISSGISSTELFIDSLAPIANERVADLIGLDLTNCLYYEFHTGAGASGEEWGVFECDSVDSAKALVSQLEAHRDSMLETYESYAPDAVPRLENAVIERAGQYVVYITAENYSEAKTLASSLLAA